MKQNLNNVVVVVVMFLCVTIYAQEQQVSSLLSNYGLGTTFSETTMVEKSQGDLSVVTNNNDEVASIANPALLSDLKLTSFSLSMQVLGANVENMDSNYKSGAVSLANISLAVPLGSKGAFSLGLRNHSSVGFETSNSEFYNFGNGSVNQFYLSVGLNVTKNLSIGAQMNRYFGKTDKRQAFKGGIQKSTVFDQSYNVTGLSTKIGAQYKQPMFKTLEAVFGAYGVLAYKNKAKGESRFFEAVQPDVNTFSELITRDSDGNIVDTAIEKDISGEEKKSFKTVLGAGLGEKNHWFAGVSYEFQDAVSYTGNVFNQTTSSLIPVGFEASNKISLGGYIIPKKYSLKSYFSRVAYRGGFKYENTGLTLNENSVKNLGISFGLGLPLGRRISYANFSFELGRLGDFSKNKYQQEYFNVGIELSLSDKWFNKRVID